MDSEPNSPSIEEKLKEWPPVEGRYNVGDRGSPVAVCTMSSVDIRLPMDKIAISGKCVTENLGVEKIVKNVIANPGIRYIIVAGRESMGHFVDNALESLVEKGVDEEGRIIGAKGGIPVLKNLQKEEIERFRKQVQIVNMAGETDTGKIMEKVEEFYSKATGIPQQMQQPQPSPAQPDAQPQQVQQPPLTAEAKRDPSEGASTQQGTSKQPSPGEPGKVSAPTHPISEWSQDPKGYFTVKVNHEKTEIEVVHHDNSGNVLGTVVGRNAEDIYHQIINSMGLITRLDHAAYLGRELGKAETALFSKADYEQETGLVILREAKAQPQMNLAKVQGGSMMDTDGKEFSPLPTHGKLIAVRKIEKTKETMLTYLVNDREFPIRSSNVEDEERFKEFLKGYGMCRVF